jgi:uncharacterized protein YggE
MSDKRKRRIEVAPATATSDRPGLLTIGRAVSVTAAGALLLGILIGPIVANNHAQGADSSGTPEHTITVSATGTAAGEPDIADVTLGVSVTKPSAKDARSAAASAMQAVVASVKKNGIADKDIVTTSVVLSPVYDYSVSGSPRLTGYQFSNSVKITVRDLAKLPAVIDDGVTAGATQVQGISFRIEDPRPLQAQARTVAMSDARTRADALAKAAGVSIKGVAAIAESSSSPSPIYYAAADAAGAKEASTPIQTGTTSVQVTVTVSYLIG